MTAAAQPPPGSDRPTRPAPLLPETLADGRYRVTDQLGVGGMGMVMRARDEVLDRDVAVKMLADNLSMDEGSRTRFLREARAAAAVTDPRVVGVFDVGEQDGRPYLVMELVDGPSLAEVLASDGPLSGDDALDVATEALAGLGSAHDAGLLHRDVKPGNLLCAPDGTVKVTDFGVAIAADGERLTRTGFVIGTAAYLAPERRRGEAATVRSDLWGLGATLMELLTGQPPGPDADQALAARGDEVPPQLRLLLRRLLAPEPDQRPRDAMEALQLLAGDGSSLTGPPQPRDRPTAAAPTAAAADHDAPTAAWPVSTSTPAGGQPVDVASSETATTSHAPVRQRPRRWPQALILVAVVAVAAIALGLLADSGQEGTAPEEEFGPVEIEEDDPEGAVRELEELLRERAGS